MENKKLLGLGIFLLSSIAYGEDPPTLQRTVSLTEKINAYFVVSEKYQKMSVDEKTTKQDLRRKQRLERIQFKIVEHFRVNYLEPAEADYSASLKNSYELALKMVAGFARQNPAATRDLTFILQEAWENIFLKEYVAQESAIWQRKSDQIQLAYYVASMLVPTGFGSRYKGMYMRSFKNLFSKDLIARQFSRTILKGALKSETKRLAIRTAIGINAYQILEEKLIPPLKHAPRDIPTPPVNVIELIEKPDEILELDLEKEEFWLQLKADVGALALFPVLLNLSQVSMLGLLGFPFQLMISHILNGLAIEIAERYHEYTLRERLNSAYVKLRDLSLTDNELDRMEAAKNLYENSRMLVLFFKAQIAMKTRRQNSNSEALKNFKVLKLIKDKCITPDGEWSEGDVARIKMWWKTFNKPVRFELKRRDDQDAELRNRFLKQIDIGHYNADKLFSPFMDNRPLAYPELEITGFPRRRLDITHLTNDQWILFSQYLHSDLAGFNQYYRQYLLNALELEETLDKLDERFHNEMKAFQAKDGIPPRMGKQFVVKLMNSFEQSPADEPVFNGLVDSALTSLNPLQSSNPDEITLQAAGAIRRFGGKFLEPLAVRLETAIENEIDVLKNQFHAAVHDLEVEPK